MVSATLTKESDVNLNPKIKHPSEQCMPLAELLGQVTPRHPFADPPRKSVHEQLIVTACRSPVPGFAGQERGNLLPEVIRSHKKFLAN